MPKLAVSDAALVLSTRSTLAEISTRVENALSSYEKMEEQQPERFAGLRRGGGEEEATYGELARSGRARVETYLAALNEIGDERRHALGELRAKLEGERQRAEESEKQGRRGGCNHVRDRGDVYRT